jgi:hypothetical protein
MLLGVIVIIYNVLWVFSIHHPYFCYNPIEQEIPILRIFKFQEPSRTQIDPGFGALIFYHEKHLEHKKSTRDATRPKRDQVAWAPRLAAPPSLVWGSSLRCHPSLCPDAQLDLKTPIYRPPPPWRSRGEVARKHEKHRTEAAGSHRRKIRGGIAAGVTSGHLSSFTNISSSCPPWRGVIHPWTMGLWW